MNKAVVKAVLGALAVALYLRFGLEPTGWLFYEASFALNIDWLYWGYSGFRGAGYALSLWSYSTVTCAGIGAVVGLLLWRRSLRHTS